MFLDRWWVARRRFTWAMRMRCSFRANLRFLWGDLRYAWIEFRVRRLLKQGLSYSEIMKRLKLPPHDLSHGRAGYEFYKELRK